jgi:hypothetical protein
MPKLAESCFTKLAESAAKLSMPEMLAPGWCME